MNLILENVLEERLRKEANIVNNPLEFLDEYLAASRGISVNEAKNLVALIEIDKEMLIKAAKKKYEKVLKVLKKAVKYRKDTIDNAIKKGVADTQAAEDLQKYYKQSKTDLSKWLSKTIDDIYKSSRKKKLHVAAATVGIPIATVATLDAFARLRRHQREKNE